MDFNQNPYEEGSPQVPPVNPGSPPPPIVPEPTYTSYPPMAPEMSKRSRTSGWRILWGLFTGLSVVANVFLVFMLIGAFVMVATSQQGSGFQEKVIQAGTSSDKIVIMDLEGVINTSLAQLITDQLRELKRDRTVKGLILRINSPGGGITASDNIYDQIRKLREEKGIPVVAFMESVAASGGYYAAVACDKIMAEPTTITGSIGVIMAHLTMEELLEDKLGIKPVVVKSGLKKDWPSSFKTPTEEQLQYLQEKLINPAYERFVDIVAEGRQEVLNREEIKELADGSIFSAPEAEQVKLVDEQGYLRDAIDLAESLAGIVDARVVEYREVFTLASFLEARTKPALSLDTESLLTWTTPEVMYLWRPF